jgi:prepilin-type N-terminal cleavage/methylation domain-containing protein
MMRARRSAAGFTIIELITVMVIIAVLAVLALGAFEQVRARSERMNCTANLRNLYAGLQSYVVQNDHWPQCPNKLGDARYDEWWIEELQKVGINEKTWHCPTLLREQHSAKYMEATGGQQKSKYKQIHYLPTPFDENPLTPRRWPTQPWLIEIYSGHGDGALMIFPDGSVISFNDFQRKGH